MELHIRSQDKMILSKISNLKIVEDIPVSPNSTVVYSDCIINEIGEILGSYRNTKRALEVLDEIQKFIERGCKEYKSNGDYYTSKYEYSVFQMPQD